MSSQSYFFNPADDRMSCAGSGLQLPRLTTTQRLALTVGANDAGLQVFDLTAGVVYFWTGSAWSTTTSPTYSEGTWTANFVGVGGSFTVTPATGTYERIGMQVHASGLWLVDGIVGVPTGSLRITGLPFPIGPGFYSAASVWSDNLLNPAKTQIMGIVSDTDPSAVVVSHYENGDVNPLCPHIQLGSLIGLSVTYRRA